MMNLFFIWKRRKIFFSLIISKILKRIKPAAILKKSGETPESVTAIPAISSSTIHDGSSSPMICAALSHIRKETRRMAATEIVFSHAGMSIAIKANWYCRKRTCGSGSDWRISWMTPQVAAKMICLSSILIFTGYCPRKRYSAFISGSKKLSFIIWADDSSTFLMKVIWSSGGYTASTGPSIPAISPAQTTASSRFPNLSTSLSSMDSWPVKILPSARGFYVIFIKFSAFCNICDKLGDESLQQNPEETFFPGLSCPLQASLHLSCHRFWKQQEQVLSCPWSSWNWWNPW